MRKFDTRRNTGTTLYCFSPAVMLTTFILEGSLALYVFVRYRTILFTRIVIGMLILLAVFQLAEYQICTGQYSLIWAGIGFTAITLLPVFGLHLIAIAGNDTSTNLRAGYALASVAVIYILLAPNAISDVTCQDNYTTFSTRSALGWPYTLYYLGFLGSAVLKSFALIRKLPGKTGITSRWILIGYLSFILPWLTTYIIEQASRQAIASVMCGFAIIFAFILAFKVVPAYTKQ